MRKLEEANELMRYQLALIKIRSAISKLHRLVKYKERFKLQRAFAHFKTVIKKNSEQSRTIIILANIKKALNNIIKTRQAKQQTLVLRFVCRWRNVVDKIKVAKEVDKKVKTTEEKLKKELKIKTQSVVVLDKKFQQQVEEGRELKKVENSLRQALKEKEDQENNMKEALEKLRKRDTLGNIKVTDNKLLSLRANLTRLENENRELKEKLETTENGVDGFVKEVNDLLDSHSFERKSTYKNLAIHFDELDSNRNGEMEEETRSGHSKSKSNTEKKEAAKIINVKNLTSTYKL